MTESIIISEQVKQQFSARATLAAIGAMVQTKGVFEPIAERVKIAQKTVSTAPRRNCKTATSISWPVRTGWSRLTNVCAPIVLCRRRLDAADALNSRWYKSAWMPAQQRMWSRCIKQ